MKQMNEEHTLLCKYAPQLHIPETITVSAYTTELEQLRLSSESFHKVMIEHILPEIISPKIPIKELYEVDYYLILRRARLVTWGPFFSVASVYCPHCKSPDGTQGMLHKTTLQARLDSVEVILPDEGKEIPLTCTVPREELLFTEADVTFSANKCKDVLLVERTKISDSKRPLLGMAASLRSVTGEQFIDISEAVEWLATLPAPDFQLLHEAYQKQFNYGLTSKGEVKCPVCGQTAVFFAPVNDYYFRPRTEDLKAWKQLLASSEKAV